MAPATAFAVVANETAPDTLAPCILEIFPPSPNKLPVMLGPLIFPLDVTLVSVPTLVILGCALVYTVPAIAALPTCPETLAPATAFAVAANETSPVTLAPAILFACMLVKLEPSP